MSSRYTSRRLSAARRRVCQAACIIAVSLLWTGGPARVHAAVEDVSLRGAVDKDHTKGTPLSEKPAVMNAPSSSSGHEKSVALMLHNVVCDTAGTNHVVIRSKKDGINLRCTGAFAVYDIPNVGEVFGPDCRRPKALENGSMKAVLDHNVDDMGAFRTLSVSTFSAKDEQFCLVCALEEDAVSAGAAEVPDNHMCSVVVTVLGTNNKDHVPEDATTQGQQVLEQAPEEPETLEFQGSEGQQPVSSAQLLKAHSSQQAPRPQRAGQRIAPRQPQQQVEQQPVEDTSRQDSLAAHDQSQPPASTEEQGAQQSSKHEEQQEEGTQGQEQEKPAEEEQKMATDDEIPDTAEDADSSEEKENTTPLQCINEDLHLHVSAGESVSFRCGDQQQLSPDTPDLVYEESEGKCGTVSKHLSDLVPETKVTKVDDATVVAVALGNSEEKTVCYRCVKRQEQDETKEDNMGTEGETAAGQSTECKVFIAVKPGLAPAARTASEAFTHSSSFLLSTVVFLGALFHLL